MEIIGLILLFLPVILKAIGKNLENAADDELPPEQPQNAPRDILREILKQMGEVEDEETDESVEEVYEEPVKVKEEVKVEEKIKVEEKPAPVPQYVSLLQAYNARTSRPSVSSKKVVFEPEEPKAHREKIDAKKMIVYSEIMRPKYLD